MLPKTWKISLISALSLALCACAGKPPAMERPIKLYYGEPARQGLCRVTKEEAVQVAMAMLARKLSKKYAPKIVRVALADDKLECILANEEKFKTMAGISFADLGVLMRYQENLLYACEKWKQ